MRIREIVKYATFLSIEYYKQFLLVTFIFILINFADEFYFEFENATLTLVNIFLLVLLVLILLGFNINIVYHVIYKKRGIPQFNILGTLLEGLKEVILESYYLTLSSITSIIFMGIIGFFTNNMMNVVGSSNFDLKEMVIESRGIMPQNLIHNIGHILNLVILIGGLSFIIFFSFCSLSKIRLEKTGNFKSAFNIVLVLRLINKMGVVRYIKFLLLSLVILIFVLIMIFYLNYIPYMGNFIQALIEAYLLFYVLGGFTLLYNETEV